MSKIAKLRALSDERQRAAGEEILELFFRTITKSRDCPSGEGQHRQHTRRDAHVTAAVLSLRAEVKQAIVDEQQQEWSPSVEQVDPDHRHIKEEQEEGDQLRGPVPVESEEEEEKADGEDREGSEAARQLRALVQQRLSVAVEEIFGLFETTLAEYEKEIEGLHRLLGEAMKLQVQIKTADGRLVVIKEEVPTDQQEKRTSPNQEDQEPPHIKEEQEELWSSQEKEQLQRLEDDINWSTTVRVKSEYEKTENSQLHLKPSDDQMGAGADGEDCGESEPARIFATACDLQRGSDEKRHSCDPDKENSDDYSQERSLSGLVTLQNEDCVSHADCNPTVKSIPNITNDTRGKPFSCSICGKRFGEKSDLMRHTQFHTGEKPFTCVFCEKTFTEKADLKRHVRVHTGEKPFSCPICGKRFSDKTDLTRHIRVHTGEKPFSCSICGKIFSQNENLRRHERIHTGEKPFSCPVCMKKFTHRGALVVHMRIHTGEKPFGCSVCGKRYRETGNLKKHMRVHTGEKPFSCGVCGRRCNHQSQVKHHKCPGESSVATLPHS